MILPHRAMISATQFALLMAIQIAVTATTRYTMLVVEIVARCKGLPPAVPPPPDAQVQLPAPELESRRAGKTYYAHPESGTSAGTRRVNCDEFGRLNR